jgi:uncharacterized repeat protein (TIGR01451 family)
MMKNVIYFLFFAFAIPSFAQTHIPDKNFADAIRQQCPNCIDGNDNLTGNEGTLNTLHISSKNINSIEGVKFFKKLKKLYCDNNFLVTIPDLPISLQELYCKDNKIISISSLPENLIWLWCDNNLLKILPNLPLNLQFLKCNNNQLVNLPPFLPNLQVLECDNNKLISIPDLPLSLRGLFCSNNQLKKLPLIPLKLDELLCSNNQLTTLPALPLGLRTLACGSNELTTLPVLPLSLEYLHCYKNQLKILPLLPQSLKIFNCSENNSLTCVNGLIPFGLVEFKYYGTKIKCLPNKPVGISNNTFPICDAKNSSNCFNFPKIMGNVFLDYNDDGIKNNDDVFVSNQTIEIKPYGYNVTSNQGNYQQFVDTSQSLTVKLKNTFNKFEIKPIERKLTTTSSFAQSYDNQDFRLVPKENFSDIEVSIVSSVQRPGFEGTLTLTYRNIGTTVLNGQIKLEKDPILLYVSAIPTENEINGHTIIWNYTDLKPFETRSITVKVKVPATTPINSKLTNKMFATFNLAGNYYESQKATELTTVVGSYDPNDKTADVKNLDPKDIIARKPITYTIRFQNTGNYHAERVEVQDTISSLFDLSTLKTIAVSHPNCTVSIEKDRFKKGQPTVVKWTFENIILPDSTSNEAASHGFVRFSIQPKQGLSIGTSLDNKAFIYFDYNLPIITNTSKVKVEKASKTKENELEIPLKVYPNPSSDKIFVETNIVINGTLSLSNLLGQVYDYQLFTSSEVSIFDIQHLPKGVYILTLKTDQGNVSRKIVKE